MIKLNPHYQELKGSYLFFNISQKVKAYQQAHPEAHLLKMGIGDVTLPLAAAVIDKLHEAVDDQSDKSRFHGYMPEVGDPTLRGMICDYYQNRGVMLDTDEVFVSSGASDELGDILDLFSSDNTVLIMEPAYPAYVDANIIAGHRIIHFPSSKEDGFAPLPDNDVSADLIYLCSPNNPTGAVFTKEKLKAWVNYANARGSIIIFDAAYEAFIEEPDIPHSIFEIEGAKTCAIEICSLSKTAGFTGTRLGYTVIPKTLTFSDICVNSMWVRNRTTKTNGVSYILQKGATAVFTEEGQKQIHQNLNVYKNNAREIMKVLDECGIWYCGGKNSPYIWMAAGNDSWAFFDELLKNYQIICTPGEGFGSCGEGYVRLSMFGDPKDTVEAAKRLKHFLSKTK